jgi:hypothetical protein
MEAWWCLRPNSEASHRLEWDTKTGARNEKIVCAKNLSHKFSGKRLGRLNLVLKDEHVYDFMWARSSECVVTGDVLEILRSKGFTGFDVMPAEIRYSRESSQICQLWELVITGLAGMAPSVSGIRLLERCEDCGRQVYSGFTNPEGLVDSEHWDGSDFFLVWPLPHVFVTSRAAELIRTCAFSGVDVIEISKLIMSPLIKTITPLALRYRLREDLARKLGIPLGIY